MVSNWRQVVPTGMSASFVVPVGPDFQDVIQVLLADDAKSVQYLVLERLNDPFDEPRGTSFLRNQPRHTRLPESPVPGYQTVKQIFRNAAHSERPTEPVLETVSP